MSHYSRTYRHQSGQALLLASALMALLVASGYGVIVAVTPALTQKNIEHHRQVWLDDATHSLRVFYANHAAEMDGSSGTAWSSGKKLAAAAGVPLKFNADLVISSRKKSNDIRYHELTLRLPDPAGGYRSERVVSGLPIENRLANEARLQLTRLSNQLQLYYAGRVESDPAHNAAVNYWQPEDCDGHGNGDWLCRQALTPLKTLARPPVDLASNVLVNPWGLDIQARNSGTDVRVSNPPYTMLLRSPYPWGGGIDIVLIQPVGS